MSMVQLVVNTGTSDNHMALSESRKVAQDPVVYSF
jgi:hypothetical protein